MKRFNSKGMMLFPNPMKRTGICKNKNLLIIRECFCQNGHNLISDHAIFNGFKGILLRAKRGDQNGLVALSPVYGYKSRVSVDLAFHKGEVWNVHCPVCNELLPVFTNCACKGKLFALFLNKHADFSNCILICNRIDCFNAEIKFNNEILHYSGQDVVV